MKKKTIYLFVLIFLVSLFSSAKKIKNNCEQASVCCQAIKQDCCKSKKSEAANEGELTLPSLGLFFFIN